MRGKSSKLKKFANTHRNTIIKKCLESFLLEFFLRFLFTILEKNQKENYQFSFKNKMITLNNNNNNVRGFNQKEKKNEKTQSLFNLLQ